MEGGFYSPALVQVVIRALCDTRCPGIADAVALVGETSEQQEPVFGATIELLNKDKIRNVAITSFPGEEREGGFKVYGEADLRKLLEERGCEPEEIVSYSLSTKFPPSTDAEVIGLVDFAKERGWKTLYMVAPPLHQVRVFVSTVSAVLKAGSDLRVYGYPAEPQPWLESVLFSQSAPRAPRINQIPMEFQKMERYWGKGDHVSPQEILDYLAWRDR